MPAWIAFILWIIASAIGLFLIVKIIGSLIKEQPNVLVYTSCVLIILATISAIFLQEIPKEITLGVTLFSYFWGLSELVNFSELDQKKKSYLRGALALTAIFLLIIILGIGLQHKFNFKDFDTSAIEIIGFSVLLLTIAMKEKQTTEQQKTEIE
jgi:hypothetical protein